MRSRHVPRPRALLVAALSLACAGVVGAAARYEYRLVGAA